MGRKVTAVLSQKAEAYYNELTDSLSQNDGVVPASQVVNYAFEVLSSLEGMLSKVTGDSDPVTFIQSVTHGTLLIVPFGKISRKEGECTCKNPKFDSPDDQVNPKCPIHGRK